MKISTLNCLILAFILLATRSTSAVDVFRSQPNIAAAYNAVLDARLKLDASPSFITPDTISKARSKLAFAKSVWRRPGRTKARTAPAPSR